MHCELSYLWRGSARIMLALRYKNQRWKDTLESCCSKSFDTRGQWDEGEDKNSRRTTLVVFICSLFSSTEGTKFSGFVAPTFRCVLVYFKMAVATFPKMLLRGASLAWGKNGKGWGITCEDWSESDIEACSERGSSGTTNA